MKKIIVGSVLFFGGLLGDLSLFLIASNKINSQTLMPLATGRTAGTLVHNVVDYNIWNSLYGMGLKYHLSSFQY